MRFRRITCSKCDSMWSSIQTWGRFTYHLQDGSEINVERDLGWCYDCDSFKTVEELPKLEAISSKLESLKTELLGYITDEAGNGLAEDKQRKIHRLEDKFMKTKLVYNWRESRESPPKCLTCGSTDIENIDTGVEIDDKRTLNFIHPKCGGELSVIMSDTRIGIQMPKYDYNGEGYLQ